MRYDAFISYNWAADETLAPVLESALERFTKPWYRRRALRVFRDKTSLSATSALLPSVKANMDASAYFILLASPEAARSTWVHDEVAYWLATRENPLDTLLLVVTGGDVVWDKTAGDFDWARSTALPPVLKGAFAFGPLWVDLRWAESDVQLSTDDPRFLDAVANLAATIHGRPKEDLIGEDVRQHRRMRQVAAATIATLSVLLVVAVVAAVVAVQQRDRANWQAAVSRVRAVAAQALTQQELGEDERGALLAHEAYSLNRDIDGPAGYHVDEALQASIGAPYFSTRLRGHDGEVFAAAFSPDGSTLATGGNDGTVRLWDLDQPGVDPVVLRGRSGWVTSLAFSPDGSTLATGGNDGTVRLWDAAGASEPVGEFTGLDVQLRSLVFGDDHTLIVGGCDERDEITRICEAGLVRAWDVAEPTLTSVAWERSVPDTYVRAVAVSPDGRLLAAGGCSEPYPGTDACVPDPTVIRVWDLEGNADPAILTGHTGAVNALAFSPDGRTLVSGSDDSTIRLWEGRSADEFEFVAELTGHDEPVRAVAFSHDGALIVSAGQDETVRLWNHTMGNVQVATLGGSEEWVRALAISPDSRLLATSSTNGSVRLWHLGGAPRFPAPGVLHGHQEREGRQNWVFGLAVSPDGATLASASDDATVMLWPLDQSGSLPRVLDHDRRVTSVAFSPDGSKLASGSDDGRVRLWDLDRPDNAPVVLDHGGTYISVAFSPDGARLASGGHNGVVRLWDLSGPAAPLHETDVGSRVWAVTFSPDGRYLATAHADGAVRLWDLRDLDGEHAVLRADDRVVHAVAFSPDGTALASGGAGGHVFLWQMGDLSAPSRVLRGHDGPIRSLAFSPVEATLATGSEDATLRLWKLDAPESPPAVLGGREEWVRALVFSPDGQTLASSSADGTVRLWVPRAELLVDHVCERVRRNLTPEEWERFVGPDMPYERQTCPNLPPGDAALSAAIVDPSRAHGR
jgi:WD40 repeat protein